MNSKDNILDTIHRLDSSLQMLHTNALNLAPLTFHEKYGQQVADVLDKIQEQQIRLIQMTEEVLNSYENRYGKQLKEVDSLTDELLGEIDASR